MSIEVANIPLSKIHRVVTHEQADFISHRIPGLEGNVVQDMGRHSVRLQIDGIFYGVSAQDDLAALRDVYKAREPVDFLAEIVGQAYFSQVIIERFDVRQAAQEPDQFTYQMTVAEYVPPPSPTTGLALTDIDAALSLDALDFMDMIQLPDLLSAPDFGDPTPPLQEALVGLETILGGAGGAASELTSVFGDSEAGIQEITAPRGGIFGDLDGLNADAITDAIEGQLAQLLSAGNTARDSRQQSGGIIQDLGDAVSQVSLPDINRTSGIQRGFDNIQSILPQNTGDILRGIPEGIDGLFTNLEDELVKPLEAIFERFSVLKTLGLGNSQTTEATFLSIQRNAQIQSLLTGNRGLMPTQNRDLPIVEMSHVLSFLPNPLTAQTLLEALSHQLNKLPRAQVDLQNIPLYDELNDKLNTALGWLNKDAAALSTELTNSTRRLTSYIHADFYDSQLVRLKRLTENALNAANLTALKTELSAIPTDFDILASLVRAGNLTSADAIITQLSGRISAIRVANEAIRQNWLGTEGGALLQHWQQLGERLEDSMAALLLLAAPSNDLKIIGLVVAPLSKLLDESGVRAFVGGLHKVFGAVTDLLKQLNIEEIMDTVEDIVNSATSAIQSLQNLLVNATIELSMLLNRVEAFINDLNIAVIVAELQGILTAFEAATVRGLMAIFSPLRDLLQTVFRKINGFIGSIDLQQIIDEVIKLIRELTKILSDPTVLDTIRRAKTTLEDVNTELDGFSIRPVTGTVIDGINIVKSAFDIIGRLPLPDSIKKEVQDALKLLPKTAEVRSAVGTINDELDKIVDDSIKPILLEIKDKPTELIVEVEKYAPDKFLTDSLFQPYNDFVTKLAELKPTVLMRPVNEELAKLRLTIEQEVNPMAIFQPLESPFNTLLTTIDHLNPEALIQPLQDKLTEGILAITSRLPLDAADDVFDTVNTIAAEIQQVIDTADSLRVLMEEANHRLAGLQDADTQVQEMGHVIATKLDSLTDFSPITAALTALDNEIENLSATALSAFIQPVLDDAIDQIEGLDPQRNLVAIIRAHRTFPRTALNTLSDSPQKMALIALLNDFDPMSTAFSAPLGGLQDVLTDLRSAKINFITFLPIWQQRYHQPSGVLSRFRHKDMTLGELKTLLKTTIQEQLTNTLTPIFTLVKRCKALLSAILTEISTLITELENQVNGLLDINTALQKMRDTIHGLVTQLNGLDITFIATEIKDIFDGVQNQLAALNPEEIGRVLTVTFNGILNAIDPNTLLGLTVLDGQHAELVALIKKNDPQKLLIESVQPEYDKMITFLHEFEISDIITHFMEILDRLRVDVKGELNKTVDAYKEMLEAVPSEFSSEKQVLLSI